MIRPKRKMGGGEGLGIAFLLRRAHHTEGKPGAKKEGKSQKAHNKEGGDAMGRKLKGRTSEREVFWVHVREGSAGAIARKL